MLLGGLFLIVFFSCENHEEVTIIDIETDLTLLPVIQKNGSIEFDLTGVISPMVNCIDCNPVCMYKVDIAGRADFSLPSQVRLIIPVSAEKKGYNVQFSIF
jgi:hypothetical protein